MSEYRLFKVIRTDGQKYFDIEYVRDVVTCGECKWWRKEAYLDCNRMVLVDMCTRPTALGTLVKADDFCSYGEREGE